MGAGGGGMPAGFEDLFGGIFGGGGARAQRRRRGEDLIHKLSVTLEEMYKGATRYELTKISVFYTKYRIK